MEDLNRPGGDIERAEKLLESLASVWPGAWLSLAEFREKAGRSNDSVSYALRRAVEEQPYSREAWIRRANFAEGIGDEAMRIACLVSAVEAAPTDLGLVREVAIQLTKYVHEHRAEIPKARRGVYLASVRSHMEKLVDQLDANSLSRLAWLYLLEENQEMGRKYAMRGCELDPNHTHCLRILANMDGGRASSPPH